MRATVRGLGLLLIPVLAACSAPSLLGRAQNDQELYQTADLVTECPIPADRDDNIVIKHMDEVTEG